jgi:hypothetical protein
MPVSVHNLFMGKEKYFLVNQATNLATKTTQGHMLDKSTQATTRSHK